MNKILTYSILSAFLVNSFGPMPLAQAQDFTLPAPGVMVHLSPEFNPPILKGIKVHPDNPFRFDFILDRGDGQLSNDALKDESSKLIKYFLASLTIPENDLWVNLSPYEKDRIIPNSFGLTEMGRDLLAEDYMLKQITASLIYPEDEIGKKFWKRIYEEAQKKYGTTDVPVNTFNKVWIVPEEAVVYENAKAGTAYVVKSKLKVMLEQDYLSLQKHEGIQSAPQINDTNQLGSQIVREIVIPELNKEVNENKNFTHLRQVYNSLILATWYKTKIKDSILEQVYADKNKVAGVNIDPREKQRIYERYLRAFKKGVFNYIKEDADSLSQEVIPRKYFSGGEFLGLSETENTDLGMAANFEVTSDKALVANSLPRRTFIIQAFCGAATVMLASKGLASVPQGEVVFSPDRFEGFTETYGYTTTIVHTRQGDTLRSLVKGLIDMKKPSLKKSNWDDSTDEIKRRIIEANRDKFRNGEVLPGQTLDLYAAIKFMEATDIIQSNKLVGQEIVHINGRNIKVYFLDADWGDQYAFIMNDIVIFALRGFVGGVRDVRYFMSGYEAMKVRLKFHNLDLNVGEAVVAELKRRRILTTDYHIAPEYKDWDPIGDEKFRSWYHGKFYPNADEYAGISNLESIYFALLEAEENTGSLEDIAYSGKTDIQIFSSLVQELMAHEMIGHAQTEAKINSGEVRIFQNEHVSINEFAATHEIAGFLAQIAGSQNPGGRLLTFKESGFDGKQQYLAASRFIFEEMLKELKSQGYIPDWGDKGFYYKDDIRKWLLSIPKENVQNAAKIILKRFFKVDFVPVSVPDFIKKYAEDVFDNAKVQVDSAMFASVFPNIQNKLGVGLRSLLLTSMLLGSSYTAFGAQLYKYNIADDTQKVLVEKGDSLDSIVKVLTQDGKKPLTKQQTRLIKDRIKKDNPSSIKAGKIINVLGAIELVKFFNVLNNSQVIAAEKINPHGSKPIDVYFIRIKTYQEGEETVAWTYPTAGVAFVDIDKFINQTKYWQKMAKDPDMVIHRILAGKEGVDIYKNWMREMLYHEFVHTVTTRLIRSAEFKDQWEELYKYAPPEGFHGQDYSVAEEVSAYLAQESFSRNPKILLDGLMALIDQGESKENGFIYVDTAHVILNSMAVRLGFRDYEFNEGRKHFGRDLMEKEKDYFDKHFKNGDYFRGKKQGNLTEFFLKKSDKELNEAAAAIFKDFYKIDPPDIGNFEIPKEVIEVYQDSVRNDDTKQVVQPQGESTTQPSAPPSNKAMLNKGGIDLTASNINLQTRNAGEAIKFHLDPAMLQQLQNAPGFVPVIINIQPMNDLQLFLGIKEIKMNPKEM